VPAGGSRAWLLCSVSSHAGSGQIVEAFLTAARDGDFEALLKALDPDVVVRSNGAEAVRGAVTVAGRASRSPWLH
jgi:ketosteroid isomerase-like protein